MRSLILVGLIIATAYLYNQFTMADAALDAIADELEDLGSAVDELHTCLQPYLLENSEN